MKTTSPTLMSIWGTDSYKGLVTWFEKNDDQRTPALAVMALSKQLKAMDQVAGDSHTIEDQMEAARMILVQVAGFIVEKTMGGLPAAVEFISKNPADAIFKAIELNLTGEGGGLSHSHR